MKERNDGRKRTGENKSSKEIKEISWSDKKILYAYAHKYMDINNSTWRLFGKKQKQKQENVKR